MAPGFRLLATFGIEVGLGPEQGRLDKLDLLRRSGTTGGPLLLSDGWVFNPGDVLDPSRVFRDGMVHFPRAGYSPDMHRNGSLAGET